MSSLSDGMREFIFVCNDVHVLRACELVVTAVFVVTDNEDGKQPSVTATSLCVCVCVFVYTASGPTLKPQLLNYTSQTFPKHINVKCTWKHRERRFLIASVSLFVFISLCNIIHETQAEHISV